MFHFCFRDSTDISSERDLQPLVQVIKVTVS